LVYDIKENIQDEVFLKQETIYSCKFPSTGAHTSEHVVYSY